MTIRVIERLRSRGASHRPRESSHRRPARVKILRDGYPAAIGAWAAAPERPIFVVTGDGGFAQYMAEILIAVGALGIRVTDAAQLDDALTMAIAHDGPALLEVISDPGADLAGVEYRRP